MEAMFRKISLERGEKELANAYVSVFPEQQRTKLETTLEEARKSVIYCRSALFSVNDLVDVRACECCII
jgi:hypothetical protein